MKKGSFCIAGMHRSGTSMVARLLNDSGFRFDLDNDLLPPAADNPDGFWENKHIVDLNNELLALFGSQWDLPQVLPENWERAPAIAPLRSKAEKILRRFAIHDRWCWKDPRNSITIPFWKLIIPDLKVIICLRNPLEAATSLSMRENTSISFGVNLWNTYYEHLLSVIGKEDRLITHYDSYFLNAEEELRRVLSVLDMETSGEIITQACSSISQSKKHQKFTTEDLLKKHIPSHIIELYLNLSAEAGHVYRELLEKNEHVQIQIKQRNNKMDGSSEPPSVGPLEKIKNVKDQAIRIFYDDMIDTKFKLQAVVDSHEELQQRLSATEQSEAKVLQCLKGLEQNLKEREQQIKERNDSIERLNHRLQELKTINVTLDHEIAISKQQAESVSNEMAALRRSRFYSVADKYWRCRDAILRVFDIWGWSSRN